MSRIEKSEAASETASSTGRQLRPRRPVIAPEGEVSDASVGDASPPKKLRQTKVNEQSAPKKAAAAASKRSRRRAKPQEPADTAAEAAGDSEDEWEDVDAAQPSTSGSVEITINAPNGARKNDVEVCIRRAITRFMKSQAEALHKTHLLCLLARCLRISALCNDATLRALALSQIPQGYASAFDADFDTATLTRFTKFFKSAFILCKPSAVANSVISHIQLSLAAVIESKAADSTAVISTGFVTIMRALGLTCRLIVSLQPTSHKLNDNNNDAAKEPKVKRPTGDAEGEKGADAVDSWAEVYSETEERWITVHPSSGAVDTPDDVEAVCTQPVHYVVGVDNDGAARDLSGRYCQRFLSVAFRRLRIDDDWWKETLTCFRSKQRKRSRIEDVQLHEYLMQKPLPTTMSEFKNHPLYALKRDLLKFQSIYPADTEPVAYIRKESVYPRESVRTLHSKETWLKDARSIKTGEVPFKIVQGRPKMGVPKEKQPEERPVPVYGFWQTEPYVPRAAENGVVPRNEYGNVDMFKPSMLPPGTVHLKLPGLLHVAKKLDIDCAPAMLGWDFSKTRNYPIYEGWIVCEEFEDTLVAAWTHEQQIQAERERERRTRRATANWQRLLKAFVVREHVRRRFETTSTGHSAAAAGEQLDMEATATPADDGATAWPQSKLQLPLDVHSK